MLTDYEMLKLQPDRVLLKCAVGLMILAGLALGANGNLPAQVPLTTPAAAAQDQEPEATIESGQSFDEMAGMAHDLVGHKSY